MLRRINPPDWKHNTQTGGLLVGRVVVAESDKGCLATTTAASEQLALA